jgi:hypothetical protein
MSIPDKYTQARNALYDSMSMSERRAHGVFYTPDVIAERGLDYLGYGLGDGWQDDYWLWDPCCGIGELTRRHTRPDRCFLSTINPKEVALFSEFDLVPGIELFQYDFVNDDVAKLVAGDDLLGDGWKMPFKLRWVLQHEPEKLIILMNPPYATNTTGAAGNLGKATDVTKHAAKYAFGNVGKASSELATQFFLRASHHKASIIAAYYKLKICNAPIYAKFRATVPYSLAGGFVVSSKAFHGVQGVFPIGFQVFRRTPGDVPGDYSGYLDILDNQGNLQESEELYEIADVVKEVGPVGEPLNQWTPSPQATSKALPLTSALQVGHKAWKTCNLSEGAIGYMVSGCNDPQHTAQETLWLSSVYADPKGWSLTKDNLRKSAMIFAVRKVVKPTWLNDTDQFTVPTADRKEVGPVGEPLNRWPDQRTVNPQTAPPLSSAIVQCKGSARCDTLTANALGYMVSKGGDIQNSAQGVFLLTSPYGNGNGWSLTKDNFRKSAMIFAVRKVVKPTWLNDRDQFTVPTADRKEVGPVGEPLNKWVERPLRNIPCLALSSAVSPSEAASAMRLTCEGAIGSVRSNANDVQHSAQGVVIYSGGADNSPSSWSLTKDNFRKSAMIFAVRKVVKPTWLNDCDQFTKPKPPSLDDVFYADCLIYTLFHGSNQTSALKDVVYKDNTYQIRNQFYPFHPHAMSKGLVDDPDLLQQLQQAEPTFVYTELQRLRELNAITPEAQDVLNIGESMYRVYLAFYRCLDKVQWKLDYWDVGWYQVRRSLQAAGISIREAERLKVAHGKLGAKILPLVYELGFLRR